MRSKVTGAQRWVVKIGSALLTADGKGLDRAAMGVWVEQMVALHNAGVELVLVSSGAVAAGMSRLGWSKRPSAMNELQAAASIGQMGLVQAWESSFAEHGRHTAQILLTHDDLSDRKRYLNARSTLRALVELKVIPVINENDTVVTDEIRFGDNDTLAALVANLVEADLLVILTDRDGMFDADPRTNPDAKLIYEARADDPALDAVAGSVGGALGRGGMQTKLRAARLAARSGAHTIIVGGRLERVLDRLKAGERIGTLLSALGGNCATRVSVPMSLKIIAASTAALWPILISATTDELPITIPSRARIERLPRVRRLTKASCSSWLKLCSTRRLIGARPRAPRRCAPGSCAPGVRRYANRG